MVIWLFQLLSGCVITLCGSCTAKKNIYIYLSEVAQSGVESLKCELVSF